MALVIADRVLETTTTTGTGPVALGGALLGYQTFGAGIGNNNTTYYTIAGQTNSEWEIGLGTLDGTSANLTRTTVYASSNGGSAVNFSAGTKSVFVTYPSNRAIYEDASGNVSALGTITSATWNGSTIGTAYGGTGSTSITYCNLTSNVTGTLPIANGGTGSTSTTYCNLTSNVTGTLPIANGGTNASTASITSLNNITGYSFAGITGNTSTYNLVGSNTPTLTTPTLTSPVITGGSIDNTTVGATTASSGAFTSITATSKDTTGVFATNAGLTANTTVTNTTTYTTAGITLANQTADTGRVWRIRAYGQFTAANSGTARTARIACFWGSTQLVAITPSVLTNTGQTTQWQIEFELVGTSTTAIWTTGTLMSRVSSSTTGANPMDNATPASTTVTAGAQTLDLRVSMSASVAGDSWIIQQVTMERLE